MNLKVFFIFLGQAPDKCQDTAMKAHAHLKCEILAKHIIHLEACSISWKGEMKVFFDRQKWFIKKAKEGTSLLTSLIIGCFQGNI